MDLSSTRMTIQPIQLALSLHPIAFKRSELMERSIACCMNDLSRMEQMKSHFHDSHFNDRHLEVWERRKQRSPLLKTAITWRTARWVHDCLLLALQDNTLIACCHHRSVLFESKQELRGERHFTVCLFHKSREQESKKHARKIQAINTRIAICWLESRWLLISFASWPMRRQSHRFLCPFLHPITKPLLMHNIRDAKLQRLAVTTRAKQICSQTSAPKAIDCVASHRQSKAKAIDFVAGSRRQSEGMRLSQSNRSRQSTTKFTICSSNHRR
jgi:hypothetical protein